jgi:outer membrane protein OmpA-like peptidoglycan-associated protein
LPHRPQASPRTQSGDEPIPVAGSFSYARQNIDTNDLYRGVVHAVRRVPNGTAVYYSVGVAAGLSWIPTSTFPVSDSSGGYRIGDASSLALVDTDGLRIYTPMVGPDGCLCPTVSDLRDRAPDASSDGSGKLYVGWAVMPPLPASVRTVSVVFGFGNTVDDVPVGDEGPLEPAVAAPSTVLGTGCPALPDEAAVAAVPEPARHIGSLISHVADLEQRVATDEQPGQVDENLSADVLFEINSATLSPAAQATIAEVAARVKERATGEVSVVGHTDYTGTPQLNAQLSLDRARAVQAALQPGVGPRVRLTSTGRGETEPVADNDTPEGRMLNRRVTVTYAVPETS